jgi:hypothetical protein
MNCNTGYTLELALALDLGEEKYTNSLARLIARLCTSGVLLPILFIFTGYHAPFAFLGPFLFYDTLIFDFGLDSTHIGRVFYSSDVFPT